MSPSFDALFHSDAKSRIEEGKCLLQWKTEHYDTAFYEDLEKVDYTVSGFED